MNNNELRCNDIFALFIYQELCKKESTTIDDIEKFFSFLLKNYFEIEKDKNIEKELSKFIEKNKDLLKYDDESKIVSFNNCRNEKDKNIKLNKLEANIINTIRDDILYCINNYMEIFYIENEIKKKIR